MRTILLSLCLLLVACSTAAPTSDGANPAARPQGGQFSTWTNSTLQLVIPGTAWPPAISSRTIEVAAKTAAGSHEIPIKLMAVYDPVAKVTSVVMPVVGVYISSPKGLMVFGLLGEAIAWYPSYVVLPGNDVDSAIAQFEGKFNAEKFTEFTVNEPAIRLTVDADPFFFRDGDSAFAIPILMTVESYEVMDNILRMNLKNGISQKQASFWIDLKEHKLIRSQITGTSVPAVK